MNRSLWFRSFMRFRIRSSIVIPPDATPPGMLVTIAWKRELTIIEQLRSTETSSYMSYSSLMNSGTGESSSALTFSALRRSSCSMPTRIGQTSGWSSQNACIAAAIEDV